MGADDLANEIDASQQRIVILVVEEVEYEFDQAKFEEYVSSSGSISPRKSKKFSSGRKARWFEAAREAHEALNPTDAEVASNEIPPTSNQVNSTPANASTI